MKTLLPILGLCTLLCFTNCGNPMMQQRKIDQARFEQNHPIRKNQSGKFECPTV